MLFSSFYCLDFNPFEFINYFIYEKFKYFDEKIYNRFLIISKNKIILNTYIKENNIKNKVEIKRIYRKFRIGKKKKMAINFFDKNDYNYDNYNYININKINLNTQKYKNIKFEIEKSNDKIKENIETNYTNNYRTISDRLLLNKLENEEQTKKLNINLIDAEKNMNEIFTLKKEKKENYFLSLINKEVKTEMSKIDKVNTEVTVNQKDINDLISIFLEKDNLCVFASKYWKDDEIIQKINNYVSIKDVINLNCMLNFLIKKQEKAKKNKK